MKNVLDTLKERGFVKQVVYEEELYKLLGSQSVTFYIGYDPTADSLHIGHFLTLMAMAHMQRAGHRPIALLGGGTTMVGDPSGRTDLRNLMTQAEIQQNATKLKKQISRFIDVDSAIFDDNAEWLLELNYVDFLREIGSCFSVNKMLTAECFKQRLERGLSFLEFNYMLMQSYDFLMLNRKYGCVLQMGGDDQWSNVLAGADLIRRKEGKAAFAVTVTLLTKSDGEKMGKTAKGAVWLDPEKTSPFDFFQYWRNVEDQKVEEVFKLLTFLELDEIAELCKYKDQRINAAKERLAYEITKLIHGQDTADTVLQQVRASFSQDTANMPTVEIAKTDSIVDVLIATDLCKSRGEARRLIEGGGVSVNEQKILSFDQLLDADVMSSGEFILHKGKKVHLRVILK